MTPSCPPPARERALSADLHRRELVGLHARIVRSRNPGIVGAAGRVVGETRNMLVLEARAAASSTPASAFPAAAPDAAAAFPFPDAAPRPRRRARSYPKAGSVWRICAPGDPEAAAHLDGSSIARRPEDRLRSRARPRPRPRPDIPAAAAVAAEAGGTGPAEGGAP